MRNALGRAKSFASVILVNLANNAARDYKNWNIKHWQDYLQSTLLAFISSALMPPHIWEKKVSSFIWKFATWAKRRHVSSPAASDIRCELRSTKWLAALIYWAQTLCVCCFQKAAASNSKNSYFNLGKWKFPGSTVQGAFQYISTHSSLSPSRRCIFSNMPLRKMCLYSPKLLRSTKLDVQGVAIENGWILLDWLEVHKFSKIYSVCSLTKKRMIYTISPTHAERFKAVLIFWLTKVNSSLLNIWTSPLFDSNRLLSKVWRYY